MGIVTRPPRAACSGPRTVAAFADTAAFSVVATSGFAIPVFFSIALPDVFAMPKTVLAVGLAIVLAVLMTVRWIADGMPVPWRWPLLATALLAFLVWNLLAAWFAIDRTQAFFGERFQYQGLVTVLACITFLLGAWTTVHGARRRALFLLCTAAGATLVATYAVIQRAGLDPIWSTLPKDRVFSTIGQSNALAAYLVLTIPLVLGLAIGRRLPARLVVAGIVVLELAALVFTLSRGGFLGIGAVAIVLCAAVWWAGQPTLVPWRWVGIAALIGVASLVAVWSVPDARAVAQRAAARALLTADLGEGSARMHLDQWSVGLAIAADHPVVGTGQDTYVLLFDRYRDRVLSPERAAVLAQFRPESPHNVYIAMAGGAGVPTLVAYFVIIAAAIAGLLRTVRTAVDRRARLIAAAFLAAVAGHLVTDGFLTAETTGSVLFWSTLGAAAALSADAAQQSGTDPG